MAPALNAQIVEAVQQSASVLAAAPQAGVGMVYAQVAQALGLAVQDSAAHLAQMLVLNAAVTAKIAEMLLASDGAQPPPSTVMALTLLVTQAVSASTDNMQTVGTVAAAVLQDFKALLGG